MRALHEPTMSGSSGNTSPSVTSALAPTRRFMPVLAPFITAAPILTNEFSRSCNRERWPYDRS